MWFLNFQHILKDKRVMALIQKKADEEIEEEDEDVIYVRIYVCWCIYMMYIAQIVDLDWIKMNFKTWETPTK